MRVSLRSNKGFSLVELMVVVAIIGIVAAVAIPNFARFSAKAKQSEAKADLAGLYTANRSFQAEWQMYVGSFTVMGYAPTGTLRYEHGSGVEDGTALPPAGQYNGPAYDGFFTSKLYCAGTAGVPCTIIALPVAPSAVAAQVVTPTTFTALANADLGNAAVQDTWTINQIKTLTNTINGLP